MVKPVTVYGRETWAVTEMGVKRLSTLERKILRRIEGLVAEQGIWRVRTDQVQRELYKDLDTVEDIKKNRQEWRGNIVRMDHRRTVKKAFESKPEVEKGKDLRLWWLEDMEKVLREMEGKR
jgi:hypothetical protein